MAASAASTQVAVSAAGTVEDIQHEYDEANMQDMTLQEREYVAHGRSVKMAKSFQNWKRSQLKSLTEMHRTKMFFMAWKREVQGKGKDLCMEDLLWTEEDMAHFLHTFCSFETHKGM